MARPLRIEHEGAVYHVTARGNERKNIFFSKTDCKKFLEYLIVKKPEEYPYSSYPAYISNRKDNLIAKELILELSRRNNRNERKAYQLFVEAAIGADLDDPMKDVYGGSILGGVKFIKESLRTLKENYQRKDEVSNRKALRPAMK